jgi:hypothetical protein
MDNRSSCECGEEECGCNCCDTGDGCDHGCSECEDDDPRDSDDADDCDFADPGGISALRAASEDNPRNLPCPTCESPNRLTPKDRDLGYQCDSCADRAEHGGY